MSFTQPVFIRKNTPELKEKLIKQGHQLCSCCDGLDGWLFTDTSSDVHAIHQEEQSEFLADTKERPNEMIDSGENENLFLALAALRDDSDYMQWFVWGKRWMLWKHDCSPHRTQSTTGISSVFLRGHKATVEEIIEHFKAER